ncbi:hypothetical protein [Blastococcus sp. PRF04-17]|uniref:hypothetical protein n=1 Tax=Blastococcus sp. PRF04-17 TaxID=2933797 RepID=UPI001FF4471D|nr:hypothetical protein [Blastococcus sp. PRF04-17]UOY00922.1 hypothetical protein MVA48_18375 [Blastococcus sp. PRF04-17]
MAPWERRHLALSGRVLAPVYGCVLAAFCAGFVVLSAWGAGAGWSGLRGSVPGLIVTSLTGMGAVACAGMALDRRMPVGWCLLGLAPAVAAAVWIVAA